MVTTPDPLAAFPERPTPAMNFNWRALAGLASGNNVGEQFGNVNALMAQHEATQQQQAQAATNRLQEQAQKSATYQALLKMDPEKAALFQSGVIDGATAFKTIVDERKAREDAARPKRSFQKLEDGTYGFADENAGTFDKLGTAPKVAQLPAAAEEYNFAVSQGFKGSFQDYQTQKEAKPKDGFKAELETMKAYRGEDPVKTFQATRDAYEKVRTSAQLSTAQGDIGLVYGFMKMLDPTSVVREGEFATAQNSGGIDETVYNIYNKALSGERLTPEQRQKFVEAAEAQYRNTEANLLDVNKRYTGLAEAHEIPTERFLEKPKTYEPLKIGEEPVKVNLQDGTQGTIRRTK